MRAIEFHGNECVELVEREDPQPTKDELLLAPLAVGVCGTDLEIFEGRMAYYRSGVASYPVVPGHEWVAEVLATGEGAEEFSPGDIVVGECSIGCGACAECRAGRYHLCPARTETGILNRDGAMASRMLFPARSTFALPTGLSTAAAAMIEPTAVALNAVRRTPTAERTVLVLGAGTVGLLAAQCARAEGAAAVLVGDPQVERLQVAAGFQLDGLVRLGGDVADDLAAVREATGESGVDVVLVCAGASAALALACQSVRPAGSVVVLALFGQPELPLDLDGLVVRDLTVHGVLGSPCRWPAAIDLIVSGAVNPTPLAGTPLPLNGVGEAMAALRRHESQPIKILIAPQGPEK